MNWNCVLLVWRGIKPRSISSVNVWPTPMYGFVSSVALTSLNKFWASQIPRVNEKISTRRVNSSTLGLSIWVFRRFFSFPTSCNNNNNKPEGKRKTDRPRLSWEDYVGEENAKKFNIRKWKCGVLDHQKWRDILEEAMAKWSVVPRRYIDSIFWTNIASISKFAKNLKISIQKFW